MRKDDQARPRPLEAVRGIRDRNAWDTAFVDALYDPPETFTFGGMVAHVFTWSAHRRQVVVGAPRKLGADVGSGDPSSGSGERPRRSR